MSNENILLALSNQNTRHWLENSCLGPAGYQVMTTSSWEGVETALQNNPPELIIISEKLRECDCLNQVNTLLDRYPFLPFILLPEEHTDNLGFEAFRRGFSDYLHPNATTDHVLLTVECSIKKGKNREKHIRQLINGDLNSLNQKVVDLETILGIGRKLTSLLDLGDILSEVLNFAVQLTEAEEGSLLWLDEETGEFYMQASLNFPPELASAFRLSTQDNPLGQVLSTGKPLLINEKSPKKIITSYLVHSIIFVPLRAQDQVIGVLEVDNRLRKQFFTDYHLSLISALADYAAIAIENANLYSRSEVERNKLESILTGVEEGVIVIDQDMRLILMNPKAREFFDIEDAPHSGKRIGDIIDHPDFLDVLREKRTSASRTEITMDDGRVMNTQLTPISEIGVVVNMQDISHLKELDRIKSDFVNTVSHDLRSPLTAILGYVELIDRVGLTNERQKEFIHHIQTCVQNITSLINDLLDLGRIEAGFDAQNEVVSLASIVQISVDGLANRWRSKSQKIKVNISEDLPHVLGNPVRLRQMVSNLISNSIKYTTEGGKICVLAHTEEGQIILQVSDNGFGIPASDQAYIFDKFFRASNAPSHIPGTGLGLAIVKGIVDNYNGRIWVNSQMGEGTTFTVVLPAMDYEL